MNKKNLLFALILMGCVSVVESFESVVESSESVVESSEHGQKTINAPQPQRTWFEWLGFQGTPAKARAVDDGLYLSPTARNLGEGVTSAAEARAAKARAVDDGLSLGPTARNLRGDVASRAEARAAEARAAEAPAGKSGAVATGAEAPAEAGEKTAELLPDLQTEQPKDAKDPKSIFQASMQRMTDSFSAIGKLFSNISAPKVPDIFTEQNINSFKAGVKTFVDGVVTRINANPEYIVLKESVVNEFSRAVTALQGAIAHTGTAIISSALTQIVTILKDATKSLGGTAGQEVNGANE